MFQKRIIRYYLPFLLILLLTGTTLAGSKFVNAEKGGTVSIAKGAKLTIPAEALSTDAWIDADYIEGVDTLVFEFSASVGDDDKDKNKGKEDDDAEEEEEEDGDVNFNAPVILKVPYSIYKDAASLELYGDDGSILTPQISGEDGPIYYELPHFSSYYFDRR